MRIAYDRRGRIVDVLDSSTQQTMDITTTQEEILFKVEMKVMEMTMMMMIRSDDDYYYYKKTVQKKVKMSDDDVKEIKKRNFLEMKKDK